METNEDTAIPLFGGDDDIIESDNHSLFITEEQGDELKIKLPEEYEEMVGASEVRIPTKSYKQYTLYTSAYQSSSDLFKILHKLRGASEQDIFELHIDSPGGYVSEGITLTNIMREIFKGRTKTVLDPHGASMGAFLFGKGDVRVCYEDSDIMYHNYSTGAFGKGGEVVADVEFSDKRLEKLFYRAFVLTGYFTEEEYRKLRIGQDFYFDAYEMCLRGIATHVIVEGEPLDAEEFVAYTDSKMSFEDWCEYQKLLKEEEEEVSEDVMAALKSALGIEEEEVDTFEMDGVLGEDENDD